MEVWHAVEARERTIQAWLRHIIPRTADRQKPYSRRAGLSCRLRQLCVCRAAHGRLAVAHHLRRYPLDGSTHGSQAYQPERDQRDAYCHVGGSACRWRPRVHHPWHLDDQSERTGQLPFTDHGDHRRHSAWLHLHLHHPPPLHREGETPVSDGSCFQ